MQINLQLQRASQYSHDYSQTSSHLTNATSTCVRNAPSTLAQHKLTPGSTAANSVERTEQLGPNEDGGQGKKQGKNGLPKKSKIGHGTAKLKRPMIVASNKDKNLSSNHEELLSQDSLKGTSQLMASNENVKDGHNQNKQKSQALMNIQDNIVNSNNEVDFVNKIVQQPFSQGMPPQGFGQGVNQDLSLVDATQTSANRTHNESVDVNSLGLSSLILKQQKEQINLFQKKIEFRLQSFDTNLNNKELNQMENESSQQQNQDSQMKHYIEDEFDYVPNSAAKKTAVFQTVKMADFKEQNSQNSNQQIYESKQSLMQDIELTQNTFDQQMIDHKIATEQRGIEQKKNLIIEGNDLENFKFDEMSISGTDARKKNNKNKVSRNERFHLKTNAIPSDNHDELQNKENVNNYLDQKIDRLRGYNSQLNNKQSEQEFEDGCLTDIHRLGQFSPSLDKLDLNAEEDEDIEKRPTLQLNTNELKNLVNESNRNFGNSGSGMHTNQVSIDDDHDYKIEDALKQELNSKKASKPTTSEERSKELPSRTGKMKDATTTEFNFTFNQQNNPVQNVEVDENQVNEADQNQQDEFNSQQNQIPIKQNSLFQQSSKNKSNQPSSNKNSLKRKRDKTSDMHSYDNNNQINAQAGNFKKECKKIQLFSPQYNNRATMMADASADNSQEYERDMLMQGNHHGQSALSDSVKRHLEGETYNINYDLNYLNKELLYPQNSQQYHEAHLSHDSHNGSYRNQAFSNSIHGNTSSPHVRRGIPKHSRQTSRGTLNQASYLSQKAHTLMNGKIQSPNTRIDLDDSYSRQESMYGGGIINNGSITRDYQFDNSNQVQNKQMNYSNIDQSEDLKNKELDLSATFEQRRQLKLHSEARIGKNKPQTCQNSTSKKMSFSNKSFAHKRNDKFPFKNLVKQLDGQVKVPDHQQPTPVFYKSGKNKPQIALDIFNELQNQQNQGNLAAVEQTRLNAQINQQLLNQSNFSPEKSRNNIPTGITHETSNQEKSLRLPQIQNRKGVSQNDPRSNYLPSIVQSSQAMTNYDDNVSTIISDTFSPTQIQNPNGNQGAMQGFPLSYQHSRRIIKIDELNRAMQQPMQGNQSMLGTPFNSEIPWEDGSPKSKYSKVYPQPSINGGELLAPLQHQTTPLSHAMPNNYPVFTQAEPYKYRYAQQYPQQPQNNRGNKEVNMFNNQKNSQREHPSGNYNPQAHRIYPNRNEASHVIASNCDKSLPMPPIQIIEDFHSRHQKQRSKRDEMQQMIQQQERQVYSGFGMEYGGQSEQMRFEQAQNNMANNNLNLPLSDQASNYAPHEQQLNQSLLNDNNDRLFFASNDFEQASQQIMAQQQMNLHQRNIVSQVGTQQMEYSPNNHLPIQNQDQYNPSQFGQIDPLGANSTNPEMIAKNRDFMNQKCVLTPLSQQMNDQNCNIGKNQKQRGEGGVYIQGHRDIKSSSKLPQAFRIIRTNHQSKSFRGSSNHSRHKTTLTNNAQTQMAIMNSESQQMQHQNTSNSGIHDH